MIMTNDVTKTHVLSIVADIVKKQGKNDESVPTAMAAVNSVERKTKNESKGRDKPTVIRGKPKSGRFWKSNKEKFSTINKTKGLTQDFAKKTALRLELKRTKELSKQALEEFKQKEILKKERRRENIKRTEENKRKAEVVQIITNTKKLKRMRKKQLRFIEKRDTTENQSNNK